MSGCDVNWRGAASALFLDADSERGAVAFLVDDDHKRIVGIGRLGALLVGQLANVAPRESTRRRAELLAIGDRLLQDVQLVLDAARSKGRHEGVESKAWVARARAEHARLRWASGVDSPSEEELVRGWREAVDGFEAFGHTFELARSQARLAAVLRAGGRIDEAEPQAAAAVAIAERLGAEPLLRELGVRNAVRTAASRSPQNPTTSRRGPSHDGDDAVLTPRESEVLGLVAQGRSNGEIGRQLFISTKTVSVHVSNVLAKLGAAGRTEAAAVARQRGLLHDEGPSVPASPRAR